MRKFSELTVATTTSDTDKLHVIQGGVNKVITRPNVIGTATPEEINILDGATVTTEELNKLDGVTSSTEELNILDGVTATTEELNIMDGVTATTEELNILDGVTATTAELNTLDGVTSTTAELNILDGVTATTAELNLLDGDAQNAFTYHSMARQAVMNGNFDVAQRGTSVTNPADEAFLLDRWKIRNLGAGYTPPSNVIHSRQELTPGDIPSAYHFYRINPDGAGSGATDTPAGFLSQAIEFGTRYLCGAGKKLTVSFWARSSIANKKIGVSLTQNYGTGGSPSSNEEISGEAWTLTSGWTKYTHTFETNTLVGKTFGTTGNDMLRLEIWYVWGTNYDQRVGESTYEGYGGSGNIDIAQVQMSSGDVSLAFQPTSYVEELTRCRRFFVRYSGAAYTPIGVGNATTTSTGTFHIVLPTPMRTSAPTVTFSSLYLTDRASYDVSALSVNTYICNAMTMMLVMNVSGTPLTSAKTHFLTCNTNGYLDINAEPTWL